MGEIWAIILAAGESKRMKVPKMLLPFHGKTMIEKVIENVTRSEVFNILVVLGSYRDEIIGSISHLHVNHCYNENYKKGMLSSVQCGFKNLPADFNAVLVFPGDQPFIEYDVINLIIRSYRETGKGIIIPVFRNKRGHPLLISRKYRDVIDTLDENEGLRLLPDLHKADVLEVKTNSRGILKDFDTKEDYLNELNK
ncbi:MAG: nucleotidyltransferase family protein [Bacteroidia bacterium]|nr:MAG: nucleotidyltransferase family protein [Bacteroidia bacterium]